MLSNQPVRTEPKYWADVYTNVANLFNQNDDARKRKMYVYVRDFVRDLVAAQLAHLRQLSGPELLAEYCRTWNLTMKFVRYMKRVLYHLQRFWIRDNANTLKDEPIRPLDKLLMFYWREELLSKLHNVVSIAMKLVASDRKGDKIDHTIIKGVVETLVIIGQADVPTVESQRKSADVTAEPPNLSLYIHIFEDEFLTNTRAFYKAEGEKIAHCGDVAKFMKAVLARLNEEEDRGKRLLHPDSAPRLRQAVEEQLIGNHLHYLQEQAKEMIRASREEDLKLAYSLLNRIENGLAPLRTFFVSFVRGEGNSVVVNHIDKMDGKDDLQSNLGLVRVLVRLYRKHSSLVKRCFDGSSVIMLAIDDAFRGFANRSLGSVSLPILMAHYIDHLLRLGKAFDREVWDVAEDNYTKDALSKRDPAAGNEKDRSAEKPGSSNSSDSQKAGGFAFDSQSASGCKESEGNESKSEDSELLSRYISELVRLFMYLDDKDLFFETHRRLFAKRLMTSHDEELETVFISKVRTQMGPTYTQRLSGMLKDKLVSNTTRAEFTKYLKKKRRQFKQLKEGFNPFCSSFTFIEDAIANDGTRNHGEDIQRACGEEVQRDKPAETMAAESDASSINNATVQTLRNEQTGNNVAPSANAPSFAVPNTDYTCTNVDGNKPDENDGEKRAEAVKPRESESDQFIIKGISDMKELEDALRVDFNAHVLNALHWPAAKFADLRVPPVLKACQRMFLDFYMQGKDTRKLSWIHSLSTVVIAATFGDRRYSLVVSTFQASALMLFNEQNSISVEKACELLNISREELCEHVKPLVLSRKCKLLTIERREREEANDTNDTGKGDAATENCEAAMKNKEVSTMEAERDQDQNSDRHSGKKRHRNGDTDVEREIKKVRSEGYIGEELSGNQETSPISKSQDASIDVREETQQACTGSAPESSHMNRTCVQRAPDQASKTRSSPLTPQPCKRCDNLMQAQDLLHLNLSFYSKLIRIHVPASIAKVESTEAVASKRNVVVDRSTQVDAALVRILKGRKEISHAALNAQVISVLTPMFLPDPRLIKSRLERLIDQEYVERDSNDPRLYRYTT